MITYNNPFEYEAASKLSHDQLIKYYAEDYSYKRFINSKRNIFLIGERGTGKTMALLYFSLPVQYIKSRMEKKTLDLSIVSVYIPCNTPLYHRKEHELIDSLSASLASEHIFVTSILSAIIDTILYLDRAFDKKEIKNLRSDLSFLLDFELKEDKTLLKDLSILLDKSSIRIQKALTSSDPESELSIMYSFNSSIFPFLKRLSQTKIFANTHFSLMVDDAHLLNKYQIKALNSWISYRDNTLFSFKVSTTRVDQPTRETSSGGSILEGHDFSRIDMELPYQNKMSEFGKLAREIIKKRLISIDIEFDADKYFPIHSKYKKDLKDAEKAAENEARKKYEDGTKKQIIDYKYKYSRAIYFRNRAHKANLPPYSGFDVLVHMSTGVIRNLLDPCWHMYDRLYSTLHSKGESNKSLFNQIPTSIQIDIIKERSEKKWEYARNRLSKEIIDCSNKYAKQVYNMLDNLAILFRDRLLNPISEPRAVVFTISALDDNKHKELIKIINIARKAQLIYTYSSSAKDLGKRETYYVPNRMLWPARGLDPIGQHARVSIQADHLLNASINNVKIPFKIGEDSDEPKLFY